MGRNVFVLLLFFLIIGNTAFAQIKVLLLNGKMREIKQYEVKGDWLFYKKIDDPKDKMRKMDKFDVFSATLQDGTEDVIYDPDTSLEGDPSVEQIRKYIKGEQYGMAVYHKTMNKVGGVLAGFASGAAGYYGPIGVFTYSIILSRFNPKVPPSTAIDPEVFNSDEFKIGYQKYGRNKKIQQSLIFGGIGFIAGFTAFAVYNHNH